MKIILTLLWAASCFYAYGQGRIDERLELTGEDLADTLKTSELAGKIRARIKTIVESPAKAS
jgi:hypothetical protein